MRIGTIIVSWLLMPLQLPRLAAGPRVLCGLVSMLRLDAQSHNESSRIVELRTHLHGVHHQLRTVVESRTLTHRSAEEIPTAVRHHVDSSCLLFL